MNTLTVPISGHLLVAHLAAYGFGYALHVAGEEAFVGHDPDSPDLEPQVSTKAKMERVADCIRSTAADCRDLVEADLEPGKHGNDRRSIMWARSTRVDRAGGTLLARESLLDGLDDGDASVAGALVAGLGAPAAWLNERPQRGASQLDGVLGNHTSDFVRGVLRKMLPRAAAVTASELQTMWTGDLTGEDDKTGWAPPGTKVDPILQWLAAVGLGLLPVGLSVDGPSRTPCCWGQPERTVHLPVLSTPVSVPRLRGLLQRPELVARDFGPDMTPVAAARLRGFGISELVAFPAIDRSTPQSVAFSFGRATRIDL